MNAKQQLFLDAEGKKQWRHCNFEVVDILNQNCYVTFDSHLFQPLQLDHRFQYFYSFRF